MYNESYYNSNNYHNYSERSERYHHLAKELYGLLDSLSLISPSTFILDYGCAFGFLLEGFKKLGIDGIGYDISEYARCEAVKRGNRVIDSIYNYNVYNIAFFLDVLEHIDENEINRIFKYINSDIIIGRIPCSYNSDQFYLEISRNDPGHINCKTKDEWKELLSKFGYTKFFHLNLNSIYDSKGVFSFIAFKS